MFLDNFKEPLKLVNNGVRLPEFQLAEEDYNKYSIPRDSSNIEILRAICRWGYQDKISKGLIPKNQSKEYGERVKEELAVLERTGFTDYILLVYSVQNFARQNNLAIGLARGSAASSLVNYLSGVTDIDPMKYGLIFSRFVSEARTKLNIVDGVQYILGSCADIDGDYGDEDREIIVKYLEERFKGRFVKLSTNGTLTTRILAKEVGKCLGKSEDEMLFVTDKIPTKFGKVPPPDKAREESKEYNEFLEGNPGAFEISQILHGCINHTSSHASAYLVCHDSLDEIMPCQLGADGVVSTYDMNEANNLAIKLDILGIQTLTIIYGVLKSIGKTIYDIDINDPRIYDTYLKNLENSYGLFQIAGDSVVRGLNKIAPDNLDELSDVIAIVRPGSYSFVDEYVRVKKDGNQNTTCPELFKDILSKTKYICVYQEDMMKMCHRLGFSMEEANELRGIVSKKKADKIKEWEPKIFERGAKNGIDENTCKYFWDLALSSADYLFAAAHSYSYSSLAAISVKLKFEYPKEFFLEALKSSQKKQDPFEQISLIQQELPYFGIKLLPPDLVQSDMDFKIEEENIRFGLSAIKGVAEKALAKLQTFINKDKTSKFQVFQAAKESGLNIGILAALVQSGCLSSLGTNRPRMVLEAQIWNKLNDREKNYCLINGEQYGYDLILALKEYLNWDMGAKKTTKSRLETIRKHTKPFMEIWKKNSEHPDFANYMYERQLLGYSPTTTLKKIFSKDNPDLKSCDEIKNQVDKNEECNLASEVIEVKKGKSKAGNAYMRITLSDETGQITGIMVGEKFERYQSANEIPKEGDIVYVNGSKGDDCVFVNRIGVQSYKIYFSTKDFNREEKG